MSYSEIVIKKKTSTIVDLVLNSLNSEKKRLFFRGQQGWYPTMVPNLYRNEQLTMKGSEYYYRSLMSEIGRDDYTSGPSLVRLLAELQHYGAKTRMLDVTSNLLVALYFAVEKLENREEEDGFVFVYSPRDEQEKFDTGHTIAIKAAMNFMEQGLINAFFETCSLLDSYGDSFTTQGLMEDSKISDSGKVRINLFMKQINQQARVREKLEYPLKIYRDLKTAHLVIPSKSTDRIRQQQGFFIFPSFVNTKGKTFDDVKREISYSVEEMSYALEYEEYDKDTKARKLSRASVIRIPHNYKKDIRRELERLGVTGGTVYPDIEHNSESLLERLMG